MKVIFDVPQFVKNPLGMQVYTEHVIREILESAPPDWRFDVQTVGWRGAGCHAARVRDLDRANKVLKHRIPVPLRFYERFLRMDIANLAGYLFNADIVHSFGWRVLPKTKAPIVVTIQDVIPLKLHEGSSEFIERVRLILSALIKQSAAIITISQFSRNEIADVFNIESTKIEVIPDGVDLQRYQPISSEAREDGISCLAQHGIRQPYLLHKGGNTKRKNKANLIRAFDLFKRQHRTEHLLILAGCDVLDDEAKNALATSSYSKDILNVGYVSADDSVKLLQLAQMLVFPSTYEGFGLPPLEAMACGVPVAMSNTSSLPEVGGNAAVYFDPYDVEAMAEAIWQLTTDDVLRTKCVQSGLQRSQTMTWQQNARSTIDVYNQVRLHCPPRIEATRCPPELR